MTPKQRKRLKSKIVDIIVDSMPDGLYRTEYFSKAAERILQEVEKDDF